MTRRLWHFALVVALGLVLISTAAEAARWQRDVVVVRDYTPGRRWGPIIAAQVDALNGALPRGAPRFVYQDAKPRRCEEIPRDSAAISICSAKRYSRPASASVTRRNDTIVEALIVLRHDQVRCGQHRVCHELMHAVTAIPDVYRSEPQSCVRGHLTTFGAWDVALLASEYEPDTGR